MSTPDLFVRNIGKSSIDKNNTLNNKFWLTLGTDIKMPNGILAKEASFFIITKFTGTNYDNIKQSIKDKNLVFDNNGHVAVLGSDNKYKIIYKNIYVTDPPNLNETILHNQQKNSSVIPNGDGKIILNPNLKYFLYDDGNSTYYILYNPIHRKSFKDYYGQFSKDQLSYGSSTDANGYDITELLANYCYHFTEKNELLDNSEFFVDPTCQCVLGPSQNVPNAIIGGNEVKYDDVPQEIKSKVLGTSKNNTSVCLAPGCKYDGIVSNDSFLSNYIANNSDCTGTTAISYCNIVIDAAGSIDTKNSKFVNNCSQIIDKNKKDSKPYKCSQKPDGTYSCVPATDTDDNTFSNLQECLTSKCLSSGGTGGGGGDSGNTPIPGITGAPGYYLVNKTPYTLKVTGGQKYSDVVSIIPALRQVIDKNTGTFFQAQNVQFNLLGNGLLKTYGNISIVPDYNDPTKFLAVNLSNGCSWSGNPSGLPQNAVFKVVSTGQTQQSGDNTFPIYNIICTNCDSIDCSDPDPGPGPDPGPDPDPDPDPDPGPDPSPSKLPFGITKTELNIFSGSFCVVMLIGIFISPGPNSRSICLLLLLISIGIFIYSMFFLEKSK